MIKLNNFEVLFQTKENHTLTFAEAEWTGFLVSYSQISKNEIELCFNVSPEILDKEERLFNNVSFFTLHLADEDSKVLVKKKYKVNDVTVNYEKSNIHYEYCCRKSFKMYFTVNCNLLESEYVTK